MGGSLCVREREIGNVRLRERERWREGTVTFLKQTISSWEP